MSEPTSEEIKKKEKLATNQGIAFTAALDEMTKEDVHASVEVADYIITVTAEKAEGMYMIKGDGGVAWMIPETEENQHIEVVVRDKKDLRFIPGLEIHCKLLDETGTCVGEKLQPYIWHPFLYHYGVNWHIPKEGDYITEVFVKQPTFHRHDEVVGKKYLQDVTVKIGPIHLIPGKKPHGRE